MVAAFQNWIQTAQQASEFENVHEISFLMNRYKIDMILLSSTIDYVLVNISFYFHQDLTMFSPTFERIHRFLSMFRYILIGSCLPLLSIITRHSSFINVLLHFHQHLINISLCFRQYWIMLLTTFDCTFVNIWLWFHQWCMIQFWNV